MKIGMSTTELEKLYDRDTYCRMLAEAGFEAVDADFIHMLHYTDVTRCVRSGVFTEEGDAWKQHFRTLGETYARWGLIPFQAHAPFPTWTGRDGDYDRWLVEVMKKTIIGTAMIGCDRLVIHPCFGLDWSERLSPEAEFELNIRVYSELAETARQEGVTLLLENMFQAVRGKLYQACCSDLAVACRMVDELNRLAGDERFGFCVDTGHLQVLGLPAGESLAILGKRIKAFHVHDNDGARDLHLAPYFGIQDWDDFAKGLRRIGWQDPLCMEAVYALGHFDPALHADLLRLICHAGRVIAEKAEKP